jgi:uncharacterized protein
MRICAVSDTHRYRHELLTAVKSAQPISAVLHAGDETSDTEWLSERVRWPIYGVAGNWDNPTEKYPAEKLLDFGLKILLIHGHRQRVKEGLGHLVSKAKDMQADLVVYGHSHVASSTLIDGVLLVNPGSLASPRGRRERTFALIDIDEMADKYLVRISHCLSTGQTLADLTYSAEFAKS